MHETAQATADPGAAEAAGQADRPDASARPLRVLMLCGHFPPSGVGAARRAGQFAAAFPSWVRVEVLAPSHRAGPWHASALLDRVARRAEVQRVPVPARVGWVHANGAGEATALVGTRRPVVLGFRAWGEAAWVSGVEAVARRRLARGDVDVLLCCAPPHDLQRVARRLHAATGVPLVIDLSDTWTAEPDPPQGGPGRIRHDLARRRQRAAMAAAATVVTATAGQRRRLLDAFPGLPPGKLELVPDGHEAADAFEAAGRPDDDRRRPLRLLVPGHVEAGMHGLIDALEVLSSTDPQLAQDACVHFLDSLDPVLRRQFRRVTVDELYDLDGHVPAGERARTLAAADALVCVVPRSAPHRIPHGIHEALAARRPILALAPPGDAWDLLAASGVARLIDSVDAAACAAGLKAFVHDLVAGRVECSPRPDWLANLAAPPRAERLARILSTAAGHEVSR